MKRYLELGIVAAIAAIGTTLAAPSDGEPAPQIFAPQAAAEPEAGIELPDDGKKWVVMVFTHDDWRKRPRERRVVAWFRGGNRRLTQVAVEAEFLHYKESDPMYQSRFRKPYGAKFPIVVVQDYSGGSYVNVDADGMTDDPKGLVHHITVRLNKLRPVRAIKRARQDCIDGTCYTTGRRPWLRPWKWDRDNRPEPDPAPNPDPAPLPDEDYTAPMPDTLESQPAKEPESDLEGLAHLAVGLGLGGLSFLKR